MSFKPPWKMAPLDEWAIVDMYHYHFEEDLCLYVVMAKGRDRIRDKGKDDEYLWNRLWHQANKIEEGNQ